MQNLTKELVVASLISDTTRLNLDSLAAAAKTIRHDRESLTANYELLLKLRGIWDFLDKRRKEEDKPDKERIATRKEGYESIMNTLAEILDTADPFIAALNSELLLQEREIGLAIKKQEQIRDGLAEFINNTIRSITAAPDNKELVRIQKLIGTEKSKKNQYENYSPILLEVCDVLLDLIDERKKLIVENGRWEEKLQKAIKDDDQPAMVEIKEQMELGQRVLDENAASISENAFKKVSSLPIVGNDVISKAIKPRTHRWAWRVDDIDLLYKKSPEFVDKEPNTKAINAFMKQRVEAEELDEYIDNKFNGLVIFRKPFYVSVKTTKDAS